MGRSKLKVALAAQKGTDFKKLREQKKFKAALKEKNSKKVVADEEEEEEEEEEEDDDEDDDEDEEEEDDDEDEEDAKDLGSQLLAAMQADSDDESDDDVEMEAKIDRKKAKKFEPVEDDDEEEDDDDDEDHEENLDIEYSDIQAATRAATAQRQRRVIKSVAALTAALDRIRAIDDTMAFQLHQSVLGAAPTAASIPDAKDDTVREKQLYSQSLQAALVARKRLRAERVPFSRPNDFFAEMVKEDGHMARVKAKLVEAATARKASAEARKQRELKKFGKQVQIEKIQERAKQKRDTLDKIKSLKRKRSEGGATTTHEDTMFDVAVDKELAAPSKRPADRGARGGGKPGQVNAKRQQKNDKYGFGGKKKNSKSGDAISSSNFDGFNAKRGGTGGGSGGGFKKQRPGKARRQASSGRR